MFNTVTPVAELERMTQFKDKSQRQETIMPLVWGLLGLILVVGFTIWLASH